MLVYQDLLIIQETEEEFHNRDEFWITHLRPSVHTRFFVYTPNEYNELRTNSLTITSIINSLEVIFQDEEEVLS